MTLATFLNDTVADGSFFTEHQTAQEKHDSACGQIKQNSIKITGDKSALARGIANEIAKAQVQEEIQNLELKNEELQAVANQAAEADPLGLLQWILREIFIQAGPNLDSINDAVQGFVLEANADLEAIKSPRAVGMSIEQDGECLGDGKELCRTYKISVFAYNKFSRVAPERLDFSLTEIYRQ